VFKQNYSYIETSRPLGVGESALRRWVEQERQGVTLQKQSADLEAIENPGAGSSNRPH
jgi:transposase-like protein